MRTGVCVRTCAHVFECVSVTRDWESARKIRRGVPGPQTYMGNPRVEWGTDLTGQSEGGGDKNTLPHQGILFGKRLT